MPSAAVTAATLWSPLETPPDWASEACPLCTHPARDEIDIRLSDGVPRSKIVREFDVSPAHLKAHAIHMARQLSMVALSKQEIKAERLVARVLDIDQDAKMLAATTEDGRTAIAALNTRLRAVDLLAKMTGLIRTDQVIDNRVGAIVNVSSDELRKMAQDVLATSGPPTPLLPPSTDHDPSSSRRAAPKIIDVF